MRVLSLGYDPVYGDDAVRTSFDSDVSVFDFDIVIWDPIDGISDYSYYEHYRGLPKLTEGASVKLIGDIARRKLEFAEFWESGRDLIVISRTDQRAYYDTGERQYSGTGKNRLTTRIVDDENLQSTLPLPITFQPAAGSRVEIVGDGPVQRVLRRYQRYIRYTATMPDAPGQPLAKVAGTAKVIATTAKSPKGGQLIILPSLSFIDRGPDVVGDANDYAHESDDEKPWPEDAPRFFEDLMAAVREAGGTTQPSRPEWSTLFTTARQRELRAQATGALAAVERARATLTVAQQAVDHAEAADQLYLGTGRPLELQVKEVLELLGGTVAEPEPGRDDWRVQFPECQAVVEVKGVTKSGAEKHAAQLEKWVASYFEETGNHAKGLLIVNAWRDVPLDERNEIAFPDQMLSYSTARQHCLITGLQLFIIREQIHAGAAEPSYWRNKIVATNGALRGVPEWHEWMEKESLTEFAESGS